LPIAHAASDADLAHGAAGLISSLASINATSEATTINVRVPNLRTWIRPALISSYILVRPRPVAAHASGIVQLRRSRNGMVEVIGLPYPAVIVSNAVAHANGRSSPRIAKPVQRGKKQK
jgi:hypothetical protein